MLVKKDLEQIKGVVKETIDGALENFAVIVKKGFDETASKTELNELKGEFKGFKVETQEGFKQVGDRLDHQYAQLSSYGSDLQVIKESNIHRLEFEDLSARVKLTETKLGIESGK